MRVAQGTDLTGLADHLQPALANDTILCTHSTSRKKLFLGGLSWEATEGALRLSMGQAWLNGPLNTLFELPRPYRWHS